MLLAHKIELRPTLEQAAYLNQACGSRRHCFNQLLAHFKQGGVKWSKKSAYQHYIQHIRPEFPWYHEVSSRVTRNAIDDLDQAFKHFFRRVKAKQKAGFPRFKKKDVNDSFALRESPKFDVNEQTLRIEKLKTRIPMRQSLRFEGKLKQVTISKRAGKFFASFLIETEDYQAEYAQKSESVGVDFGINAWAVCSNGHVEAANQKLKTSMKKLAKRHRALARKQKGSHRRAKAKSALAKLHFRIVRQREAVCHELSHYLTANFKRIVIEDLNVKGMVKNHRLARAVSDAGFGMLRKMIEYKALLRNCEVVLADRFFPSSKMCSGCGTLHDMPLDQRMMTCDCGLVMDRDLNAAINLNNYGVDTFKPTKKRTQEKCQTMTSVSATLVTV